MFRLQDSWVSSGLFVELDLSITCVTFGVVFYAFYMLLTWIHHLPREEAEKLAVELGVSAQGSLDELRKKLKDKWRALEAYLPPHVTDKLVQSLDVAGSSTVEVQGGDSHSLSSYIQSIWVCFELCRGVVLFREPCCRRLE